MNPKKYSEMKNFCSSGLLSTLFEPDILLPSQFFNRYNIGRYHFTPEKRLVLAVLEDAVAAFQKYAFSQDPKGRELFREAKDWIMCDDTRRPFSFRNICDALALDPSYWRRGLIEWEAREGKKIALQIKREELATASP